MSFFEAGLLTEVHAPSKAEEAVRDLCRCREAVKKDLGRMRHRLLKFALRHGFHYTHGKNHWTKRHMQWLRGLKFEDVISQTVFLEYLSQVEDQSERLEALDRKLEEVSREEPYKTPVGWLRCFHGIDVVTGLSLVAELYAIERFHSARQLMSYLGLTPGEHSSGEREQHGGITKAGNGRVRRLLVEAGWQYRRSGVAGQTLKKRREGQPEWVIRIAKKAHKRLHKRYWRLTNQGKTPNEAVVSVARELTGFIWGVLHAGVELAEEGVMVD